MLHRRRILITSPEPLGGRLARDITALGGIAMHLPFVMIRPSHDPGPLDRALDGLAAFDWVLFTSSNGVRAFFARVKDLGIDERLPSAVRFGAVGSQTASLIETFGQKVDFVPSRFTGVDLARQIPMLPGQRFLLPAADIAGDTLARELKQRGGLVTRITVYRTEQCTPSPQKIALVLRETDAILFSSGSAVTAFADTAKIVAELRGAIGSIGPSTSATLRRHGLDIDFEAIESTAGGLCLALERYFSNGVRWRQATNRSRF